MVNSEWRASDLCAPIATKMTIIGTDVRFASSGGKQSDEDCAKVVPCRERASTHGWQGNGGAFYVLLRRPVGPTVDVIVSCSFASKFRAPWSSP